MKQEKENQHKVVATNRKAYHDYFIEEKLEAGIMLRGTEVKSLRDGRANLQDSYASVDDEEVFLHHCHISPYSHGNIMNHDPLRPRKLLLHRKEINKLIGKTQQKGLTLIPLRIYFSKQGKAKVELALAKGKKQYDRRESIKAREAGREVERAIKGRKERERLG
jgi:SsrA-binding protein